MHAKNIQTYYLNCNKYNKTEKIQPNKLIIYYVVLNFTGCKFEIF